MNKLISNFKITGNVSVWQIPTNINYPLWNFACDYEGRKSLITALELMINDEFPSKLTVTNASPLELGQIWIQSLPKYIFYDKLIIRNYKETQITHGFTIIENTVVIPFNSDSLNDFHRHINECSFDISMKIYGNETIGFW